MQNVNLVLEALGTRLLTAGKIPKHVAFIADGARRFGKKYEISVQENHEVGLYGCMFGVIDLCLEFGVVEYSILMYSFGNYYRPKDEVSHWIVVLRLYLIKCIENWKILKRKGIRFNFYGKFVLIPEDINSLLAMLQLITRKNDKVVVNFAMGYTSKHELSSVAYDLIRSVRKGELEANSFSCDFFQQCLLAVENRNVDLMIRTSGHKRISDFLCWQVSSGCVYFNNVLWPEFNKIHFMKAIFYYQQYYNMKKNDQNLITFSPGELIFLNKWKSDRLKLLYKYLYSKFFKKNITMDEIKNYDYETLYEAFVIAYDSV